MNVFQPAYQSKRTIPTLFLVAREITRTERARLAAELNAAWPRMLAGCSPCVGCCNGHTPYVSMLGVVFCSECKRALYKAAEPDVARVLLSMESLGSGPPEGAR